MSRQWKTLVPSLAVVLALSGCGICSDNQPSSEIPMTPAQQAEFSGGGPPPPSSPSRAEVSCMVGEFPRSSARLNNVDKACLDDVVQRLQADPRAHVVVVGYADDNERDAGALARGRADAVQDYLVRESGVDSGRIRVRSSESGRPLDMGAGNAAGIGDRRCEVWFVPDGATDPRI